VQRQKAHQKLKIGHLTAGYFCSVEAEGSVVWQVSNFVFEVQRPFTPETA
jgi:hypothetical protein